MSRADEAREPPTPRRLLKARHDGEVPVSPELAAAASFAAAALALVGGGAYLVGELARGLSEGLARAPAAGELGAGQAEGILGSALTQLLRLAIPILACAGVAALLVGLIQTRGLFAPRALVPRAERLRPRGRLSGGDALAAVGRVAALVACVGFVLAPAVPALPLLAGASPRVALAVACELLVRLVWRVLVVYVVLGGLDLARRIVAHRRALRMTRRELDAERRETEGDERLKAERRRRQAG